MGEEGKPALASSAVIFNASPLETVDLMVGGSTYQGPSEVELLRAKLKGSLEGIALMDLTAADVAFLVGETGEEGARIELLAKAEQGAASSKAVPPNALYGLFRTCSPTGLPTLLLQSPAVQRSGLLDALSRNLIPTALSRDLETILDGLQALAVGQASSKSEDPGNFTLGDLLGSTPLSDPKAVKELVERYIARPGTVEDFWAELRKDPVFGEQLDDVQLALQLGVLTQNNVPLVERVQTLGTAGQIKDAGDLVKLDATDWLGLIAGDASSGPVPIPESVPGTEQHERESNYARTLAQIVEATFPTMSIREGLASAREFPDRADISSFLARSSTFEFGAGTVAGFIEEHPQSLAGLDDPDSARSTLKSIERVFKFAPRWDELQTLIGAGLNSALAVSRLGVDRFVSLHGDSFESPERAEEVFESASSTAATAMHMLATYAPVFNRPVTKVVPFQTVAHPGVPNWESLFGSIELCSCDQCRSVLSPAAYLTDLLAFLRDRAAKAAGKSAQDVLFERRPDLGEIELSCENTNTAFPHVDLVNETLENAISPSTFTLAGALASDLDRGAVSAALAAAFAAHGYFLSERAAVLVLETGHWWHVIDTGWRFPVRLNGVSLTVIPAAQTSGSPSELAANPEHMNASAYDVVRGAVYPWTLPFDLWLTTARAYLSHLGVARHELMRAFQTAVSMSPSSLEIATEQLGMSSLERQIIDGTNQNWAASPWQLWGYATAGGWAIELKGVRTLLDRAGLTYSDLQELLRLSFINPGRGLTIEASAGSDPATCDTTKLTIGGLAEADLGRILRFTRMAHALGWTLRDLDKAITALRPINIDEEFIRVLASVEELRSRLGLPVVEMLAWYAPIDTVLYPDIELPLPKSLYQQLFQNPAVIKLAPGEPDPFQLNAAHTELETVVPLVIEESDNETLKNQKQVLRAAMSAALGISDADLALLLEGPLAVVTPDRKLTVANASRMFRTVSLAHALGLSVEEMLSVPGLTGIDPFGDETTPVSTARTKATGDFLQAIADIRKSGFTIAMLEYLLRHELIETAPVAPSEASIATMLDGLRSGLKKIDAATAAVADPLGEHLAQQLSVLGWSPTRVHAATDTIGGLAIYTQPLVTLPPGVSFPQTIAVGYDASAHELTFTGAMQLVERTTLLALSSDATYQAAVQSLFAAPRTFVEQQMKTFVDPIYTARLAALPAGLDSFPSGIAEDISYDSEEHLLSFTGTMGPEEEATLLGLSAEPAYQTAVNALAGAPTTYLPPADNAFLDAAQGSSLFDIAHTPESRYEQVLAIVERYLRRGESESLVKQTLSGVLKLGSAQVDCLLTEWSDRPGEPAHRAMQELLSETFIDTTDKLNAARFPSLFRTCVLLGKVAYILARLSVSADELRWLIANAETIGWLELSSLPTEESGTPAPFDGWQRLVNVFAWRAQLSEAGTASLFSLLGEALAFDPGTGDANATKAALLSGWSALTGWPVGELEAISGAQEDASDEGLLGLRFPIAPGDPNDYADERTWLRVRDAFALLGRLGASTVQAVAWSKPELTADDARNITQAVKSKYEPAAWLEIAKPLRDPQREQQRAALVAYLLARPDTAKGQAWTDADGLYEWFLIDVQMSPCMLTSRIQQAISAAQLFAQRCLINLETEVEASAEVDAKWAQWEWMSSYSIWAGAREIFLWPENWIQPELRDGKSPFFTELESTLLQNEVTTEHADDAFLAYLEKLDQVAQLEVAGVYHEIETDARGNTVLDTLHVFGRTPSNPPIHYYRRREHGASWTAWEKVDVDLKAPYILPVVWNRRLYLFWPILTLKGNVGTVTVPQPGDQVPPAQTYWEIQIGWSEYKDGRWTTKTITEASLESGEALRADKISLEAGTEGDDLLIFVRYMFDSDVSPAYSSPFWWSGGLFRFLDGRPGSVRAQYGWGGKTVHLPTGTVGQNRAYYERSSTAYTWSGGAALWLEQGAGKAISDVEALAETPTFSPFRLQAQSFPQLDPREPIFYQDKARSYMILPTTERIPIWRSWGEVDKVRLEWVGAIPERYYQALPHVGPDPAPGTETALRPSFPATLQAAEATMLEPPLIDPVAGGSATNAAAVAAREAPAPLAAPLVQEVPARALENASAITIGKAGIVSRFPSFYAETAGFDFQPFYHPFVRAFYRELNRNGIDGMMQRPIQTKPYLFDLWPSPSKQPSPFNFESTYKPHPAVFKQYPVEDVDFTSDGSYSLYNWELFFHAPLLIAERLSANQQFADASRWLQYIFDPTDTSSEPAPQKYWRMGWFFQTTDPQYQEQQIERLLELLASGSSDLELAAQVNAWREQPFNPHAVARLRTTAYQKTVVMRYLDNLIAWGDQLYRQNTLESINHATQLYVLASNILGRRPEVIEPRALPLAYTYNALEPKLDSFSDALVEAEALVPPPGEGTLPPPPSGSPPVTLMLYFGVPQNEVLIDYWDTIENRLFQIRHCMNIEGVIEQLPLFEPPVNPALLVAAAAAGVDLASALSDMDAALPPYRFTAITALANVLIAETRGLAAALLAALEHRDAEALALLRSSQETAVLDAMHEVREQQVIEAQGSVDALTARLAVIKTRQDYYARLMQQGTIAAEQEQLGNFATSKTWEVGAAITQATAGIVHLIPDFKIGSPFTLGGTYGGSNVGASIGTFGSAASVTASVYATLAAMSAASASYARRAAEWQFQKELADNEYAEVGKQIIVAEARHEVAKKELAAQALQVTNAQATDEFLHSKFTNEELYNWMVGQISTVYFQSYQLAYDVAKRAERCFRHELGMAESSFITFGYWDSLKRGLLAADRLGYDLRRMEAAYLEKDQREYELAKTIPLSLVEPRALVSLRETGECFLTLPESLFDLDYPGHYMRRLRSVALTIPCVAGPYTGVHCTLSYLGGTIRVDPTVGSGYAPTAGDPRFLESNQLVQSIATSHGQEDSGLFEVSLRDERYLPFERLGVAGSQWRLRLDPDANRFDLQTITDVLLQMRYTAREGGDALRAAAKAALPQEALDLFSARHDFSDAWQRFLYPAEDAISQTLELDLSSGRFPYRPGGAEVEITRVDVYLKLRSLPAAPVPPVPLQLYANATPTPPDLLSGTPLLSSPAIDGVHYASVDLSGSPAPAGAWTLAIASAQIPAFLVNSVVIEGATYKHLDVDSVEDLIVVCRYRSV